MIHNLLIRATLVMITAAFLGITPILFPEMNNMPVTGAPTTAEYTNVITDQELQQFIQTVTNGQAGVLTGVYVKDVLSLPVVQQPGNNPAFVSNEADVLTQFGMPSQYGTTGLLAHNTLAGSSFAELLSGDQVVLIYGDGSTKTYQVDVVRRYQALSPTSPYSQFVDLASPDRQITSSELFNQIYTAGDQVVFQTCIEAEGNPSWGRLFVTATPYEPIQRPISLSLRDFYTLFH